MMSAAVFCFVFLCQTMPVAMALLRDFQNLCPKDVLNFILDLIKYNDNRKNKVKAHIHSLYTDLSNAVFFMKLFTGIIHLNTSNNLL